MSNNGRIHCFLVATDTRNVIYERYYDQSTDVIRAEIRNAFHTTLQTVSEKPNQDDPYVGNYKGAAIVFILHSDILFFCMGSGEYDELSLTEVIYAVINGLKDVIGKALNAALLFENYSSLCLTIDEVIYEGILENVNKDLIRKGTKMKVPWET